MFTIKFYKKLHVITTNNNSLFTPKYSKIFYKKHIYFYFTLMKQILL